MDGPKGMLSIFSGKLTTFRLMAEEVMDLVMEHLATGIACRTAEIPLDQEKRRYYRLPERLEWIEASDQTTKEIICECEIVTRLAIEEAITASSIVDLDDVRRDLRLGMGPCQAGFCSYRALGIAHEVAPSAHENDHLGAFLDERWRGLRPLGWGVTLRQMEMVRRIYIDLLNTPKSQELSQ
jgi:glycerol-3-phosphate dehydrogenase